MPDLTTLSLGAGLQSSTIVEMVVEGLLSKPDLVIFADTGDEPQYVYNQVDYLDKRLQTIGLRVTIVNNSNMVEDLYTPGRRFVALPVFSLFRTQIKGFGLTSENLRKVRLKRQCTREYKIQPIEKCIREKLLELNLAKRTTDNRIFVDKGTQVEAWLGISLDEAERIKPSRVKFIEFVYPLINLHYTKDDCADWLIYNNLPIPQKSSCIRCPFHNNAYYLNMKTTRPDEWERVVNFDHDLRNGRLRLKESTKGELFMHQNCIPLEQVKFSSIPSSQQPFEFCDEGYCWT